MRRQETLQGRERLGTISLPSSTGAVAPPRCNPCEEWGTCLQVVRLPDESGLHLTRSLARRALAQTPSGERDAAVSSIPARLACAALTAVVIRSALVFSALLTGLPAAAAATFIANAGFSAAGLTAVVFAAAAFATIAALAVAGAAPVGEALVGMHAARSQDEGTHQDGDAMPCSRAVASVRIGNGACGGRQ